MPSASHHLLDDDLIRDPGGGLPRLLAIMFRLRDPDAGGTWEIYQTPDSIARYMIQEAQDVADAFARREWPDLEGELVDLLLPVVDFTQMGSEAGHFDFSGVARKIPDGAAGGPWKSVRRGGRQGRTELGARGRGAGPVFGDGSGAVACTRLRSASGERRE